MMAKVRALLAGLCLLLTTTTATAALQLDTYAEIDNWKILRANSRVAYGCTVQQTTGSATDFKMFSVTLALNDGMLGLVLTSPQWEWVKTGEQYTISNKFDAGDPWDHVLVGVPYGFLVRTEPSEAVAYWLSQMAAGNVLTFYHDGDILATFPLKGSAKALEVWAECIDLEVKELRAVRSLDGQPMMEVDHEK